MSDEEYSFLKVRRSSRKINLMMKHSTPLTSFYMGSLPTVNEWEEDSYLSNHSPPLGNKNDLQQVKNVMTNMPVNHEEIGIANKLSPLLVTENSAKDQSLSVEDSTGKIKNAKEKEDTNLEISQNQSILRTPKKYLNRKKLRKLLIKKKVDKWVSQQLNNIEEATQHNLVIENV